MIYHVFRGPKASDDDLRSLGHLDCEDKIYPIEEADTTIAHLLVKCGKFVSVKEGKKNGWNTPVPLRYSDYEIGQGRKKIFVVIYNPSTTLEEFRCDECTPDGRCVCG